MVIKFINQPENCSLEVHEPSSTQGIIYAHIMIHTLFEYV